MVAINEPMCNYKGFALHIGGV